MQSFFKPLWLWKRWALNWERVLLTTPHVLIRHLNLKASKVADRGPGASFKWFLEIIDNRYRYRIQYLYLWIRICIKMKSQTRSTFKCGGSASLYVYSIGTTGNKFFIFTVNQWCGSRSSFSPWCGSGSSFSLWCRSGSSFPNDADPLHLVPVISFGIFAMEHQWTTLNVFFSHNLQTIFTAYFHKFYSNVRLLTFQSKGSDLDPAPYQRKKSGLDPHQSDRDPQHCTIY